MFALIQRGQIYADQHGWPVLIHSSTSEIVRYWRQGRINTASIDRFNNDFEYLNHREAAQIRAARPACGMRKLTNHPEMFHRLLDKRDEIIRAFIHP